MLRQESAHEEGGERGWAVATTRFEGDAQGNVTKLHAVKVGPPPKFDPIPGTEFTLDVDLVLLAMGFLGPVRNGMIDQLGRTRCARQREMRRELHVQRAGRLRIGRYAPWLSRLSYGRSAKGAKPRAPWTRT
jgi:NADPH-dependent glutamate synthase beta subunit-like oxidoreductase